MSKHIFLLRGTKKEDYNTFKNRIFTLLDHLLNEFNPETMKVTLTTGKPPTISIIPFRKQKVAVISATGASKGFLDTIERMQGYSGGYVVEEAIPVKYEKIWGHKQPTPGVCLLTLFHSKPGMDRETFLFRWHNGHTPLSLKLHPLWNYNRNVVLEAVSEDTPWYDGIVEEQFKTRRDLLNPFIFFGPPLKVPLHMIQVLKDTRGFIDMKRIEPYLAEEIHFCG